MRCQTVTMSAACCAASGVVVARTFWRSSQALRKIRSLICSLIQLRPEAFDAQHVGQAAEVTNPRDLRRTQARRLGKRVGGTSSE
jgi:hypothetical protein